MSSQAAMAGLDDLLGRMSINETPGNTRSPSKEALTFLRPIVPSGNNHRTLRVSPTSPEGKVILFDNLGDNGSEVIDWWLLSGSEGKKKYKTLSIMFRGGGLDPVCAKSGWSYDQNNENALSPISCSKYTRKSVELCRAQRFELGTDKYDGDIPGQFKACFAEMQLIAYLAEERRPDLFESDSTELGSDKSNDSEGKQEEEREEKKQEQQVAEHPFDDHVLIITNLPTHTPPYVHCEKFAEVIGRLLRTKITLENRWEPLNLSDSV